MRKAGWVNHTPWLAILVGEYEKKWQALSDSLLCKRNEEAKGGLKNFDLHSVAS